MTHEELRLLLAEYAAGQLGAMDEHAVSEHLDSCSDCRESVEAWQALAQEREQHVASSLLVAAAVQRNMLGAGQVAEIEQHLASCETCRADYRAIQLADQDAQRSRRSGMRSGWRWAGLAASLVLAVFLVRELIPSERSDQLDGGAFELTVLRGGLRSGNEVPTVSCGDSDRFTPLAVVPSLPSDLAAQVELLFELRNQLTVVYSLQLKVEEVQRLSGASQAIVLLVPTERLRPGRHRLSIRPLDRPAAEPLLDVAFEVRSRGQE